MARGIAPLQVNLVEHDGWKDYSSDQTLMAAVDSAYEMFKGGLSAEAEGWIEDIVGGKGVFSVHDWSPKAVVKFDDRQIRTLAQALRDGELELTGRLVTDAATGAFEETYTPSDRDIKDALKNVDDLMFGAPSFTYLEDEDLWMPLIEAGWTPEKIMESLFSGIVYDRQADHYDRWLRFEFQAPEAMKELLDYYKKNPERAEKNLDRLEPWLKDFFDEYVYKFFIALKREMKGVDLWNRFNFQTHWKIKLQDKREVKAAVDEMTEYLKEHVDAD